MELLSKEYDFVIIDPTSTEFNRGSFCYLPYILFCALSDLGHRVLLLEDFTTANIDSIPSSSKTLISLWSYPQIEASLVLNRFLERDVEFFGYYPLIESLSLPKYEVSDSLILKGIKNYPKYYDSFKYLLLSDCDMHLSAYEGLVYPLFTSYGCPRKCSFCPSSVNCNNQRIELPVEDVIDTLNKCHSKGIRNIHFTDEDFFFNVDRAYNILNSQINKGWNFIALGSVSKVQEFVNVFGERILEDSGVKLIEVGFETGDSDLAKSMYKPSINQYELLSKSLTKVKIFWLTLTFFPGETITSLNKTGEFLKVHGLDTSELFGRVVTNGTTGGLGQFFQLYHGVKDFDSLSSLGIFLTDRPMRLIPSFVPYSFLNSRISDIRSINKDEQKWFKFYKVDIEKFKLDFLTISELTDTVDGYIFYAICARLGVIK